ncbi:uncharacterized protein MELLADRAFT_71858 [Melampsora larici-populina 98AG31]|uniref:Secreted protein n=1 Tax=Melampsora larici-populina (strain 98AG31 / pathotype 3-4-7) TaxID=747676 RepID=F4RL69_MELLP|nr:uncharacterized protein MELLADRAFT_71858 [Melampsora larici-populina 98AG31]EGG06853.1 secreted protein [Melampsora larici-populina 98AG31]
MLTSIKSLVLFVIMTYSVSAMTVAVSNCRQPGAVTIEDCTNALSTYHTDHHGFVSQDKPDNQKSCGSCQIHVYTGNGENLKFSMEGAQAALDRVLRTCGNGYGAMAIPETSYDHHLVPTVLSVEKGSGRHCDTHGDF